VVKGGFLNLPLALSKYLQSKGGRIITNSKVTKIIIKEGKAVGVKLTSGKEIRVKRLVAQIPIHYYLDLLEKNILIQEQLLVLKD